MSLKGSLSFRDLYTGYSKRHGRYVLSGEHQESNGKATGTAITKLVGATQDDYRLHIEGKDGIGIIPLLDDGKNVHFGAIDIDDYTIKIEDVARDCAELPVVLTHSKSGGVHIWLFCATPTPASLVRKKLSEWAARLGHGGCEIFPKQVRRANEKDAGNWINLPYFGDTRVAFIAGKDVPNVDDFVRYANEQAVNEEQLKAVEITAKDYSDGPPCLQHLLNIGIPEGGRNTTLTNLGVYFKRAVPDGWEDALVTANAGLSSALPFKEMQTMISSLKKKEYGYQCQNAPLKQYCDRLTCVSRKFGVGDKNADLPIELTDLAKIDSSPPVWFLTADGIRFRIDSIKDLMNFKEFRLKVVQHVPKALPHNFDGRKWDAMLQTLFDNLQVIEAPDEAGQEGELMEHFRAFLTLSNERKSASISVLLKGNSVVIDDMVYFRSTDLGSYLKKNATARTTQTIVWAVLREIGAIRGKRHEKGATIRYWAVPVADLGLQTEDFDAIPITDTLGGPTP